MLARLEHIAQANQATGRPLNLSTLLRDHPSSSARRKLYRKKLPAALFQNLADAEDCTPKQARGRLENLRAYGWLGLEEKVRWPKLIDPRLWSYIEMLKLGRLNDTLGAEQLTSRVHKYATYLGIEPLTTQVAQAVFNHFPKQRYANSGEGPQLYGVKRRGSLNVQGAPLLHEHWLMVQLALDIQLVDLQHQLIEATCSVVLAIECATQMPMGIWPTHEKLKQKHVCLGLYQAIWHPGALSWPLRGIPEHILVDKTLEQDGLDALSEAALWLDADVAVIRGETRLHAMPIAHRWMRELQQHFAPTGARGHMRKQQFTMPQLYVALLQWLQDSCFQRLNNDPVPAHIRKHGFALPGFDTPAAGLLLPVTGKVLTVQNGVKDEAFRYASPVFMSEPGTELEKRSLPLPGPALHRFIFVEQNGVLHYMTQQRSSR